MFAAKAQLALINVNSSVQILSGLLEMTLSV
jgi:hypothetical protein